MTGKRKRQLVLVDGLPEMTLTEWFQEWNGVLRPVYRRLGGMLSKVRQDFLQNSYKIGRYLNDEEERILAKLEREGKSTYGLNFFNRLGHALGCGPRILRDCATVAKVISPEEFQRLSDYPTLTWGHLRAIAVLPSAQLRSKWLERVRRDELTMGQLVAEMKGERDAKPRGPGRSPALPKNVKQALHRFDGLLTKFANSTDQVLFGDRYDIAEEVRNMAPDQLTNDVRDRVAACLDRFVHFEQRLPEIREKLFAALRHIEATTKTQKEYELTMAAEQANDRSDKRASQLTRA